MPEKKFCSRCVRELDFFDLQQDFSIHKKIGYGSIYDGCTVDYQLCCGCFDKAAEECVVFPISEEGQCYKCDE